MTRPAFRQPNPVGKNVLVSSDGSVAASNRPVLIGRADELTRLEDIADLAVEDRAQMVLLSGDAGIGKSSLTAMFLDRLGTAGWSTHVGHCIEYADRPLPFGPIVTILRSVLLDNVDRVDDLVGHHRDDLAGLLPELRDGDAVVASLAGDTDRLFDAISTTLVGAARRRPMAVVVEDVHWADPATRDLVASLVHTLGRARVLLVVTERAGAVGRGHPVRTWLAEQRRHLNVHSMELEGFSRDELSAQAISILGHEPHPHLVDQLVDRTAGNAYFAHELLVAHREGSSELPTSLVAFLTSRLERLDPDEREVLRAVAVAGGVIGHPMLAAMLPDLDAGPIVRRLFDASILTVEGSDYTFGHALLREAILDDLLPFEAEDLHRRAAEAILADPRRGSSLSDLASLAMHWDHANDPDRSLVAAALAADAAASVAAYETAAELSLQALRAWPSAATPEEHTGFQRDDLLLHAAEWLGSCFRGEEAVALVDEALRGWGADLPPGRRALLMARTSFILYHMAQPADAATLLETAEQLVGDEMSADAAQVHHRVSKQAVANGQIHPALEAAERAIAIAQSEGPVVVLAEALTTKALAIGVTRDPEGGVLLATEARDLALEHGLTAQVANTYRTSMLILYFVHGRTDESLDMLKQGLEYAEQHCGPRWRADLTLDLCLGYVEAGRLRDAEPLFARLMASKQDDMGRLTVLQTTALYGFATDDLELAELFLSEATEIAARYQSAQETGYQFRLQAELARRHGRLDDALELIDRALELQLEGDNLTYTRDSIVEKIRIVAACRTESHPAAEAVLDQVRELVRDFAGAGKANEAMRALMELELEAVSGQVDVARAGVVAAALASCGFNYEAAQVRYLLAERLLGGGAAQREQLEQVVTDLHASSTALGMSWIVKRVEGLARAGGIQLDAAPGGDPASTGRVPTRSAYPHDLTAREVEVMSLLAEGLTNKAIGERLYVSPRTVGTHVSNLLAKLGVSTRGEAAAAYHRLGLDEEIDLRESAALD